jgi:hypothetical protein
LFCSGVLIRGRRADKVAIFAFNNYAFFDKVDYANVCISQRPGFVKTMPQVPPGYGLCRGMEDLVSEVGQGCAGFAFCASRLQVVRWFGRLKAGGHGMIYLRVAINPVGPGAFKE